MAALLRFLANKSVIKGFGAYPCFLKFLSAKKKIYVQNENEAIKLNPLKLKILS